MVISEIVHYVSGSLFPTLANEVGKYPAFILVIFVALGRISPPK